jgi:hypothetical protein
MSGTWFAWIFTALAGFAIGMPINWDDYHREKFTREKLFVAIFFKKTSMRLRAS